MKNLIPRYDTYISQGSVCHEPKDDGDWINVKEVINAIVLDGSVSLTSASGSTFTFGSKVHDPSLEALKPTSDCRFPAPGYEQLAAVLTAAHDQSAFGKGKERHGNGLPFHEQRMQSISQVLDSPDGMAYQVIKKMTEGLQFTDAEKREHELLGAIVYLAGLVVYLRNQKSE